MILADKIISLRKKAGWSQEELAEQLNVTRQSVSKWEGAQSAPDLDRVLQMSRLFGVTTDYLLKDELEEAQADSQAEKGEKLRRVSMEEASAYLSLRRAAAPRMALAAFLCVISPVALMVLAAMSESARFHLTEDAAAGFGLCVMLVLAAVGAALFLGCASRSKGYAYLEKEPFETEYGVSGMVRERMKAFEDTYNRLNMLGTVLCILSALPLFAAVCVKGSDILYVGAVGALLVIAGAGVAAFVYGGTCRAAMDKLLEEGEYTRPQKAKSGLLGAVSGGYWLLVTAVFLLYTFGPSGSGNPRYSWIIWTVGGVLFGVVMLIMRVIVRAPKDR